LTSEVTVGAIADVHSPKYLEDFKRVLNNSPDVDLMLLAGDMIYKGRVEEYENVLNAIRSRHDGCRVVACFGNEEYDDRIEQITKSYNSVTWLNDEHTTINVKGLELGIFGTKGCLDRPTAWQRKNIPNIDQVYEQRLKKIDEALASPDFKRANYVILLSHYSTTFKTLVGEPRWAWPEMGSSRLEEVVGRRGPHLVIHGHAHNSKIHVVTINRTQVYNVSFPATRKLTIIKLRRVGGAGESMRGQAKLTSFMTSRT
jgi:Icc-related predicted phosphoesterase